MTPVVPTMATRICEWAERAPRAVALREKSLGIWHETTWAEYWDRVEQTAHGLVALGVKPGDRVAIESENRSEWPIAEAGAVAARAVGARLDARACVLIAEGQEHVDRALEARAGLPELEWIVYMEPRGLRDYAEPSLVWWPDLLARGAEHRADHPHLLKELAGEVGDDDPVTPELTAGEANAALATQPHPDPGPDDFVLCHLALSEMASRLSSAWLNADAGVQLHFGESSTGLVQTLNEVEPSLFLATPGLWDQLRTRAVKRRRLGLRKCRSAVSTSPIAPELSEWYRGLGIEVHTWEVD
jgi:long-chain acyl-CoA synthetase